MKRRNLILQLALTAAWPRALLAQESPGRVRRIGVLMNPGPEDQEQQTRLAAFVDALKGLGWTHGRNVQIEFRWAGGDADRLRAQVVELVALAPDVILATGGFGVRPLQRATRTIPIVFVSVADPVGSGFVTSLARPGGNATGFANFEYGISAKWLELLKQIAPQISRAAVFRDPALPAGSGLLGAMQSVAPSLKIELIPIGPGEPVEIEAAIRSHGQAPGGGLIATPNAALVTHRTLLIELAAQYRLPAVYPYRYFAAEGGLMSYGPDTTDQYRLCRRLRRSYPEGREGREPSRTNADQVRAGHQYEDRKGARSNRTPIPARARGRGY